MSQDGTKIAYVAKSNGVSEIGIMNADGSQQRTLFTSAAPALGAEIVEITSLSMSANGQKLVFTYGVEDIAYTALFYVRHDVYVINTDGTGLLRLTSHSATSLVDRNTACLSPDGSTVVYSSDEAYDTKPVFGDLYRISSSGGPSTRLTFTDEYERHPAFSPDGSKLVCQYGYFRSSEPGVLLLNADGTGGTLVNNGVPAQDPCFSPDGTRIAFQGNVPRFSPELGENIYIDDIVTVNLDGTGFQSAGVDEYTFIEGFAPAWGADAR